MKRRRLPALIITLAVMTIVGGYFLGRLAFRALPDLEGISTIGGLTERVDIYRDDAGFPHILANNENDAWIAAGYVHAQDRLWQMDVQRRYGMGRLSELFGADALPIDRMMRSIGIHRIADSLLHTVSEQTRGMLDAYARGVNAAIAERSSSLPIEFDLLQYEAEPWLPVHSLIIARLMGWELALSWWTDLMLQELIERFGEEKAAELFPGEQQDGPVIHSTQAALQRRPTAALLREGMSAAQRLLSTSGSAIGSNAWAVSAEYSRSGKPLLANDPHLLVSQPSRWYVMHISAPGFNVGGVTIPGAPGVIIGHNAVIAWGMTNLMADDVDFFYEDVNYRDSTVIAAGESKRLTVHSDSIFIRGTEPVVHTTWQTERGPIISPVYPLRDVIRDSGRFAQQKAISMRWAGQDTGDDILAIHSMNRATTWTEFEEALTHFTVPAQHIVYADTSGIIAGIAAGRIPIRGSGRPLLPSSGWEREADWRGYVPPAQMPRSVSPAQQRIVAANNRVSTSFPWHISSLWESDARARRIHQLLDELPEHSAEDFRLMQMDVHSVYADTLRKAFVTALHAWNNRPLLMTRVMNLLAAWDLRMSISSVEATIYNTAVVHVLRRTLGDEMDSTMFENYTFLSSIPTRILPRLLADTATTWFDDITTPGVENSRHMLIRGITDAVTDLRARFGADMRTWTWGRLHTLEFAHPLGRSKPLDMIFNIGPFAVGGNNTTINNTEYSLSDPYDTRIVSSMRFIADLATPDSSYIILTTGQSGQPFSRHYADHTPLWLIGGMHRLVINTDAIRRSNWKRIELRP